MAAKIDARRIEQRRTWQQLHTPPRKNGAVVVDGFEVRVQIERGRLLLEDGVGRDRRTRRYTRAEGAGLARLVVLGGSGSLSLEALRWLAGVGAALICVDRDGRLLCTTAANKSEAKLRRAQALAPHTGTALTVARFLLTRKLEGQRLLLDQLPADGASRRSISDCVQAVAAAETIEQAVTAEAKAAAAYWRAWQPVPVRFRPSDRRTLPMFAGYRSALEEELRKEGFDVFWKLLNASDYGVPQLRPRTVLVGLRPGLAERWDWPRPKRTPSREGPGQGSF